MSNETEQRSGWWIEFKRGWWMRSNPPHEDHIERGQGSGHYSGNVTEEQAKALEKIVSDYLATGDQPPRFTAYGMREFIGRAVAYWKTQPGEGAAKEAAEMAAMLDRAVRPEAAAMIQVPREDLAAACCAVNRDRWACSREGDADGEAAMAALHDRLSLLYVADRPRTPA